MEKHGLINDAKKVISLTLISEASLKNWTKKQSKSIQTWLSAHQFVAEPGTIIALPSTDGDIKEIIAGYGDDFWHMAAIAQKLPQGVYRLTHEPEEEEANNLCLAWALSYYSFDTYKKKKGGERAQLLWPKHAKKSWVQVHVEATCLVRDLINTPACDLTPLKLAETAKKVANSHKAKVSIIRDKELEKGYPAVYAVGKAADAKPCLIDMHWKPKKATAKIALVGKGVCFDSGGLDIKPSSGMLIMKKDMGGGAHALAMAQIIMACNLPIEFRLLIPAVENAINGNAMHPMDIIKTRKGLTVEIGNTDAEGRLILADALYEASTDKPDLIIDFATLTGAARVALGTDLPALFCNRESLARDLLDSGLKAQDPLWHMPLHKPYKKHLKCPVADLSSTGKSSYGGAITAALFLEHFVPDATPWVHIDLMAWNLSSQPGRPEGGEAMGLRAVSRFLQCFKN